MNEPVIGIDLGTTYSAVATVEPDRPRLIIGRGGQRLTPSMVGILSTGERVVGEAARMMAEQTPENVAHATKRFIGKRWSPELAAEARASVSYPLVGGPTGDVRLKLAGRTLPVVQVAAMILGELKLDAQAHFGRPVSKAVVTVPANFDDAQRNATKEAARIAGLDVLRIINEPTAAAVAYGVDTSFRGRVLVFDLGGGTFDVSILEAQDGLFEVKATGGDSHLGGEDYDLRIVQWLLAQVPDDRRELVRNDRAAMARLKSAAELAKRELSDRPEAVIVLPELLDPAVHKHAASLETVLTREFFERLVEPLSRRCLDVCRHTMEEAKLDPRAIDQLLLVGGMTRVPLVRRLAQEFFGREAARGINPDEVVALGAAAHAHELAAKAGNTVLIDVVSHSLGVGVLGGSVRRVVEKNTPVPCSAKEVFLPTHAGQSRARIPVFQGESSHAEENRYLGEVVLAELEVNRRGEVPIEVSFEISAEGILSVRAVDLSTGMAEATRIDARTALLPSELDQLSAEESEYSLEQGAKDAASVRVRFSRMLDRAQKLARLLEKSAQENPSAEASAAVGRVLALIDAGRAALTVGDAEQMAEIIRAFTTLLGEQRARQSGQAGG